MIYRLCAVRAHTDGFLFLSEGGIFMSTEMPVINMTATGSNIKILIKGNGLRIAEVQEL